MRPTAWSDILRRCVLPGIALDLRALALLRVGLAYLVLADLALRWGVLTAFYGDAGVLPREALLHPDGRWRISLYFAGGATWFTALLTLAAALAATALWVGWRTRTATLVLAVLMLSLLHRNPLVADHGDLLVVALLIWALCLPVAARWSVDASLALRAPPARHDYRSWATAGLLLQVLSVPLLAVWTLGGDGWLAPGIALGAAVLALSPLWRTPARLAALLALAGIYLWRLSLPEPGLLPWAGLVSLAVLVDRGCWDAVARRFTAPRGLRIYHDGDCEFCRRSCLLLRGLLALPQAQVLPAQDYGRAHQLMEAHQSWVVINGDDEAHLKWDALVTLLRYSPLLFWLAPLATARPLRRAGDHVYAFVVRHRGRVADVTAPLLTERDTRLVPGSALQWTAGGLLLALCLWHLAGIGLLPEALRTGLAPALRTLALNQDWRRALDPPQPGVQMVVAGILEDGAEVNVLAPSQPLAWDAPQQAACGHDGWRWRLYRARLGDPDFAIQRPRYGAYLCRRWNAAAASDHRLHRVYLTRVLAPAATAPAAAERQILWRHDCHEPRGRQPVHEWSDAD